MSTLQRTRQEERFLRGIPGENVPANVFTFCDRRGILPLLRQAISVALEHFKVVRNVETRLQSDPDIDMQRVIIDLTVDGNIDEILACKDAFDKAWSETAPVAQLDAIRLLYDFA